MKNWILSSLLALGVCIGLNAADVEIPAGEGERHTNLQGSLAVDLPGLLVHPVVLSVKHAQSTRVSIDGAGSVSGDVAKFSTNAVINGVEHTASSEGRSQEQLHFVVAYNDDDPIDEWADWMNEVLGQLMVESEVDDKIDFQVTEESVQLGLNALLQSTLHGAVARSALPSAFAELDEEKAAMIEQHIAALAEAGYGDLKFAFTEEKGQIRLNISFNKPQESRTLNDWVKSGMRHMGELEGAPDEVVDLYAQGATELVAGVLVQALVGEIPEDDDALEELAEELMFSAPITLGLELHVDVNVGRDNRLAGLTAIDCDLNFTVDFDGAPRGVKLNLKHRIDG